MKEQIIELYEYYAQTLNPQILNEIRIFIKINCCHNKNATSFHDNTIIFDDDSGITKMEINDILSTLIL